MKLAGAFHSFGLVTLVYLGVLYWLDRDKGLFAGVGALAAVMPVMLACILASLLLRFARWHWLLSRAGGATGVVRNCLAYFSGFAFTATPGKVGELLRIRYLQPMGVEPSRVLAAFVFERSLDLIVVLFLASLASVRLGLFPVVLGFVSVVLAVVLLMVRFPYLTSRASAFFHLRNRPRLARLIDVFSKGFSDIACWGNPLDLVVSAMLGLVAWGFTAYAFVLLVQELSLGLPVLVSFSLYPAAMLAGAATMMPGGLGTTEAALTFMLSALGTPLADAGLAAVGIRLASLWFAMLLGLVSVVVLETVFRKAPAYIHGG